MSRLASGGISVDLPGGWDGQIRSAGAGGPASGSLRTTTAAADPPGEGLVLHAATFALPSERGDYGSGAVEQMGGSDVLVCLLEHERAAAATALFAQEGLPHLTTAGFSPQTMQRAMPGMAGSQHFFQLAGRPFCLYVVVGTWRTRGPLVAQAARVVASIQVDP